jgi:hypothetical protein
MSQEFIIKSPKLEDKINQLLPSQGGFQAGVDLSASTQIIPIVDLTETAEGSDVRVDLQTALSFSQVSAFNVSGTTTTIINTTGYYRIVGVAGIFGSGSLDFNITDGASTKLLKRYSGSSSTATSNNFDFIVFVNAGISVNIVSGAATNQAVGVTRQIADISGNLVDS